MTTGIVKYSKPVCSFCGVKEEEESCKALVESKDCTRCICDQRIKGVTALLKANPGRKHLRYLPKRSKK